MRLHASWMVEGSVVDLNSNITMCIIAIIAVMSLRIGGEIVSFCTKRLH